MNIQRKKLEELLHELGRYKKKVSDDAKVIKELRETIEGWEELDRVREVLLTAVLIVTGVSEDKPAVLGMDDINARFNEWYVGVEVDMENRKYKLYPKTNTTTNTTTEDATEQLNAETEQETGN